MMAKASSDTVADWLTERRASSGLVVEQVPITQCQSWSFADGALQHATGRFFSVVGVHCESGPPHLAELTTPMIDQPEVGILGFVVRQSAAGWQWLLQAKTEPGNVHGTQVGPTVQATRSNYLRVHGGQPTEMIDLFAAPSPAAKRVTHVEQSEQGDRFLGKYNLNAVVEVDCDFQGPAQRTWRWFDAHAVREALTQEFTFNTDARSVLCCTDWSRLCSPDEPVPFGRWRSSSDWGHHLLASHQVHLAESGYTTAVAQLEHARAVSRLRLTRMPLQSLPGWSCGAWTIDSETPGTDPVVETFRIHSADREVQDWCQPLLSNRAEGHAVLICTQRDGALRFFIPPRTELGFAEHVQFGPSLLTGRGHANGTRILRAMDHANAQTLLSVRQSDEGGRFKDSVARYQIVEVPPGACQGLEKEGAWVSLSALRHMAGIRGLLSNELRSCISLLLSWA